MSIDAADDATHLSFHDRHPSLRLVMHEWLHRDRMRGQDSHETMEVRPFSGHRHRRGKASPQGVPGRSTGPGKDTAGRSECGADRTGRLATPAYQSADRCLSQARPETGVYPLTVGVENLRLAEPRIPTSFNT